MLMGGGREGEGKGRKRGRETKKGEQGKEEGWKREKCGRK